MNRKILLFTALAITCLQACESKSGKNTTNDKKDSTAKAEEVKKVEVNKNLTALAKIMGAIEIKETTGFTEVLNQETTKKHYEDFKTQWAKLEDSRLSKMRPWRDTELAKLNGESHTLFYPFSGPDFLNAYEFFPNCDNYLMFGLEPAGNLPDVQKMPQGYLEAIRRALAEIFQRNYFITSYMGGSLYGKGVLPIMYVFLSRTGNQIVDTKRIYIDKKGNAVTYNLNEKAYMNEKGEVKIVAEDAKIDANAEKKVLSGLMIEFLNDKKEKSQKIYYFGTDVQDNAMPSKMELVAFIKNFKDKIAFVKSASYLLHGGEFSVIRDLVLQETSAVLQDDTGIRYDVYLDAGWGVQLYGKYARPIADFGVYTYQQTLAQAFQVRKDIKPLNFTYGYHWNSDNTSVMLCFKGQGVKQEKAENKADKKEGAKR